MLIFCGYTPTRTQWLMIQVKFTEGLGTIVSLIVPVQSLAQTVRDLESHLEAEQEKLSALVKSLSLDGGQVEEQCEEVVSEEWLQSLKERRKVSLSILLALISE